MFGTLLRGIRAVNCDPLKDYPPKRRPEMTGPVWGSPECRGTGGRAEQQSLGGWGETGIHQVRKKKKKKDFKTLVLLKLPDVIISGVSACLKA